jgi:hypothetical protein
MIAILNCCGLYDRALSYAAGIEGMQPAVEKKGCGSDVPTALERELKSSGVINDTKSMKRYVNICIYVYICIYM